MRFADAERMKESTLKRFLRLPKFDEHLELHRMDCLSSYGDLSLADEVIERQFDEHLELHRMDCLSSYGDLSLYNFVRERLQQTPPEEIRPQPLLSGEDLIALDRKSTR